ncbi:MFS general substrate transporter [Favolaschia claudopus]|uniref:MFS general substrate transporter n=1 Tax=Favolaschia claudopus TaxID=2862362 RepID=A0AAV9Z6Z6_9AGAR
MDGATNETEVKRENGSLSDSASFPEGGIRAWATVLGAFLIQFCGFGYTTNFYVRDYLSHSSSSAISWIGSVNALLIISVGLFIGRLYDRGHFRLLLYGGCFLQAFSLFMLSLAQRQQLYQMFLTQGVGLGLGAGLVYIPSVAIVSHYFHQKRALAMSIVASGSSFGAIVHPIMLNHTLHSTLGFGSAVRASAGVVSGSLLCTCLLMRPRLPPTQSNPHFWRSVWQFCHDVPYVLATLGLAFFSITFYWPLFFLQLDTITHGIHPTFAFYSLVIFNASSFVSRICPGFFAHSLGIANMATASEGGGAVLVLGMIGISNVASVVVLCIFGGFFSGMFITMMAPLVSLLTRDLSELGLRMGLFFAMEGIGDLIGKQHIAPTHHRTSDKRRLVWWRACLFSGLSGLVSFGFFVAMILSVRRAEKKAPPEPEKGIDDVDRKGEVKTSSTPC